MTCIHASVSRSPRGHSLVAPDKRHCRQWMSSLFCGFLPYPFIHDLFLWRTSQELVKTDLYPLSLTSVWYAVCLTGCGWDNRPLLRSLPTIQLCGRKTTTIKKLAISFSKCQWMRRLFGCPDFVSLTKINFNGYNFFHNFYWKYTRTRALEKNIIFPMWTG